MKFDKILELAKNNIIYINFYNKTQYDRLIKESRARNVYWSSGFDTVRYYNGGMKYLNYQIWFGEADITITYGTETKNLKLNNTIEDQKNINVFNFNQVEFDNEELE